MEAPLERLRVYILGKLKRLRDEPFYSASGVQRHDVREIAKFILIDILFKIDQFSEDETDEMDRWWGMDYNEKNGKK